MNNKPNDCDNYDTLNCPHLKKDLMKEYIAKVSRCMPDDVKDISEGLSMAPKVYETFCETCESKKPKYDQREKDCLE
jgi:hypothetical protein